MKTKLLLVTLCFGATSLFAQTTAPLQTNTTGCKAFKHMPADARPVFPKTAYTPLEDPSCAPCYEYRSKYGYKVMECPYLWFPAEHGNKEEPISGVINVPSNTPSLNTTALNTTLEAQAQSSYTGNYPKTCKRDPNMPARAVPAWPTGAYTPLEDPSCAPCYKYRSKYGYMVMECPFLQFPAEHRQ